MRHEDKMENLIVTDFKLEHIRLREMISEIERACDCEVRQRYFLSVKAVMISNLGREESMFKADAETDPSIDRIVTIVDHDHHELKEFLQRLNLIDPASDEWMVVFKEFKNYFFNHTEFEDQYLDIKEDMKSISI